MGYTHPGKQPEWFTQDFFFHSGDLKPARIRILPQGSLRPGIFDNTQQIRQNVYSTYHQDRYRHLRKPGYPGGVD